MSAPTLKPNNWTLTEDFGQWFISLADSDQGSRKKGVRSVAILTIWGIWKERNSRVFNRTSRSVEQVLNAIKEEARLWIRAGNEVLEELTLGGPHQTDHAVHQQLADVQ